MQVSGPQTHSLCYGVLRSLICSYEQRVAGNQQFCLRTEKGSLFTLGFARQGKEWKLSNTSSKHARIWHALRFVSRSLLDHDLQVVAARLGRQVPKLNEYEGLPSILLWWTHDPENCRISQQASGMINLRELLGEGYKEASFLQIIHSADETLTLVEKDEHTTPQHIPTDDSHPSSPRLSTIPEGTESDLSTYDDHFHFNPVDNDIRESILTDIYHFDADNCNRNNVSDQPCGGARSSRFASLEGQHTLANAITIEPDKDAEGNPCVQIYLTKELSKLFGYPDSRDGEAHAIQILLAGGAKRTIVKRDDDDLDKAEQIIHAKQVFESTVEELKIWQKYGVFKRRSRRGAENLISSRYVIKWKWVDGRRLIRI